MRVHSSLKVRNTLVAYAFLLPALVLLGVYTFFPIVFGGYLAFTQYNVITPPRFVGLENFRALLGENYFWTGLMNSIRYIIVVPVIQVISIAVAMLVNRKLPLIGFFRTAYYIPVVSSMAVIGLMWGWMYDQFGPVNYVLKLLGLIRHPINFLLSPAVALYAVMFVTLWMGIGYYMVLYLAGLQSIDRSYEEAALIDGASRLQVFRHVTLPLLRPVVLVCSLLSTISAIRVFGEIFVMTQGGPAGSTYTALYFIYSKAFQDFQYGEAAAAGLVVAVVVLIFSILNFRYTRGGRIA